MTTASKLQSAEDVALAIPDGATIALPGNASIMVVDHLLSAIEARFRNEGRPRQLTAFVPCNAGLGAGTGVDRLAHRGLLKRYIASAFPVYNGSPLADMILNAEVEAYNLPMGVLYNLLRDIGAGRPGLITEVGIGTYVDPREQGGKMNAHTREDLVGLMPIDGTDYLFYRSHPIHVTLLKASSADEAGNLSFEKEPLTLGALALATAAKASGGKVYAQVERIVARHSLHPKSVVVPEHLVDGIVLAPDAPQSAASHHDPSLTGEIRAALPRPVLEPGPSRVIIARTAAQLRYGWLVNLGVGLPNNLPRLLWEARLLDNITITTEHGGINGLPNPLPIFGAHTNPDAVLDPPDVFNMYDSGILDAALLGMAEADARGDVNVSKFNGRLMGCGGFIDITARTRNIFFCGTLTAGGGKVTVQDGKVVIEKEGRVRKLVREVQHRTFNGRNAVAKGQKVHLVTERGLFLLTEGGWVLSEIAPGIDPHRDIAPHLEFELQIAEDLKLYPPEVMAGPGPEFCDWLAARLDLGDEPDQTASHLTQAPAELPSS
ncbi:MULTISPECIES: CoA-transferase [unclassified Aurantimonas]|uniref:CoA-transferase n=1 Tax=unclassified Aurantimonas TaxID=2638230 RepID=UPI002E18CFDA|nr:MULTISPECIES: CoA-transferase [unclassified Aurantimonas]MEC5293292.1 CoA-transferase [Aurantimonas sp. C2-3-R2]MEC5414386.1 CoA-transferase [Aurantimonas sp. C2-4-R8]